MREPLEDPFATIDARGRAVARGRIAGPEGDLDVTAILGYEAVRAAARDRATFSSDAPTRIPLPHETSVRSYPQLPLESDPPVHARYRAVFADVLDRHRVERHASRIRSFIDRLVDDIVQEGGCEVVLGLAVPAFTHALALVAGRPQDESRWARWGKLVYTAEAANPDFETYLDEVLEEIESAPEEDAFGRLGRTSEGAAPFTAMEQRGLIGLFLAAGRDTTVDAIAGSLFVLGSDEDAWRRLRQDPGLLGPAVDEVLRYISPIPHIGRLVTHDTEIDDLPISGGSWVSLGWRYANHDPDAFPDPNTCRIDRVPNRHVAFGHGPHTCLGMHLALMVVRSVLASMAARIRTIDVRSATFEEWIDLEFDRIPHGFQRLEIAVGDA